MPPALAPTLAPPHTGPAPTLAPPPVRRCASSRKAYPLSPLPRFAPQIPVHSSVSALSAFFPAPSIYMSDFISRHGIDCADVTRNYPVGRSFEVN